MSDHDQVQMTTMNYAPDRPKAENPVKIEDLSLRDGHQSLFATRGRTEDMIPVAEKMDEIGFWAMETWGGATFDTMHRYLQEDPWERLRTLKKYIKKTPFSMLLREEDTELRDNISEIMRQMNLDGTTEALKHTYIDDVIAGEDPEAVVPQEFENAKTIKVAVTGDRPPMDYISAGGEPMGFNTALIAEVAKRLEMNVEFVSMDSAARGVSLATGVSDVVFWMEHTDFGNWDGADVEDQPEHTIATEAYLTSPYSLVVLDSSPLAEILQAP